MTEEQQKAMEESDIYLEGYLCVNDDTMANIRLAALERYCTQEIELAKSHCRGKFCGRGLCRSVPLQRFQKERYTCQRMWMPWQNPVL